MASWTEPPWTGCIWSKPQAPAKEIPSFACNLTVCPQECDGKLEVDPLSTFPGTEGRVGGLEGQLEAWQRWSETKVGSSVEGHWEEFGFRPGRKYEDYKLILPQDDNICETSSMKKSSSLGYPESKEKARVNQYKPTEI